MLTATNHDAPQKILSAIANASEHSGVDFSYLVTQASVESSFNPNAKARTSSATGLYQFIDSTWLSMIDKYGDDYGINTEGKSKQEILNMRKDPETSSFMAAAFASENEKFLNAHWGGEVGSTELYLAHFMGANGAASFLNARDETPLQNAADLFPRAARANRNVFYDAQTGQPRTMEQVYAFFDKKFDNTQGANTHIAQAPIPPSTPTQKLAQNTYDAPLYTIPNAPSNSIIMQRSQALREQQEQSHNSIFTINRAQNIASNSETSSPFLGMIAQPVDIMLLTQTAAPGKVIRDNA